MIGLTTMAFVPAHPGYHSQAGHELIEVVAR